MALASVAMVLLATRTLKRRNAVSARHVWASTQHQCHTVFILHRVLPSRCWISKGLFLLWIFYVKSTICITGILGYMRYFCTCLAIFICCQFTYTSFPYVWWHFQLWILHAWNWGTSPCLLHPKCTYAKQLTWLLKVCTVCCLLHFSFIVDALRWVP